MMQEVISGVELSPSQKRVWNLQKLGFPLYNQLKATLSTAQVADAEQLLAAIENLALQHEILKTQFSQVSGSLYPLQASGADLCGSISYHEDGNQTVEVVADAIATIADPGNTENWKVILVQEVDVYKLHLIASPIISDKYSLIRFLDDLQQLQFGHDTAAEMEEILPFTQYSEWHNSILAEAIENDETEPFYSELQDALAGNTLSFEKSAQMDPTHFQYSTKSRVVTGQLLQKLNDYVASREELGVSGLLFSCWQVMLWYYLDQPERMMAAVNLNGRSYEAFNEIFGLLGQTIPFELEVNGDTGFEEYSAQLTQLLEEQIDRQELFHRDEDTQEASNPGAILPYQFDVTEGADANQFTDVVVQDYSEPFKLKMSFEEGADAIKLNLDYAHAFIDPEGVDETLRIYEELLDFAISNPDTALTDLFYPTDIAIDRHIVAVPDHQAKDIVSLFEAQVAQNPDLLAVSFQEKDLTYRELNNHAKQFAHWLINEQRISQGDVVAVKLKRSEYMVAILLGILKTGAAYLPLSFDIPDKRLAYVLENSSAVLLISHEEEPELNDGYAVLNADLKQQIFTTTIQYNPDVRIDGQNRAYVIYTSGSTGAPKGVEISHHSLLNYVNWFNKVYEIKSSDKTILFSSVSMDLCYTGLWTPILGGASLVIFPEDDFFDSQRFIAHLRDQKITYLKATPSHFNMIVNDPQFTSAVADFSLRLMVLGGEKINTNDIAQYYEIRPDVTFVNHYGPTETTIGVLTHTFDQAGFEDFSSQPVIGKPIDGVNVCIVDAQQRVVSPGIKGEIAIMGAALALGYLNDPELTSSKFIPAPFAEGQKMYLTGDLGRQLADGSIAFIGRKDTQVKVRGYRVDLTEVEMAIRQHTTVLSAAVVQSENSAGDLQINAFYKAEVALEEGELKTFLADHLPDYMIPAAFKQLDDFPLTKNGKTDYQRLKKYEIGHRSNAYVAPENEVETQLVEIWKEVLDKAQISVTDSFLEIGGHSLKAVQMLSRIHQQMHVKIDLKTIFECKDIRNLAGEILQTKTSTYSPIPQQDERVSYDLSLNQKRLWVLDQFEHSKIAHNRPSGYRFENLDVEVFRKAFLAIIDRHESLRTNIVTIAGGPQQVIREVNPNCFEYIDLSNDAERERKVEAIHEAETNTPFDLANDSLIRAKLIRVDETGFLFLFTLHHITSDGWTIQVITKEMTLLYEKFLAGEPSPLEPLRVQYKDFAAWQNGLISGGGYQQHQDFWASNLSGNLSRLALPTDFPRSTVKSYQGGYMDLLISRSETDQLVAQSNEAGGSLFMSLLTLANVLLYHWTNDEDIIIGTVDAGRNHPDLEDQVGFYINNLVLRNEVNADFTYGELLQSVTQNTLEVFKYKDYPFNKILEDLKIKRDLSRYPIYDVVLSLQNADPTAFKLGAHEGDLSNASHHDTGFVQSVFDLIFDVRQSDEGLRIIFYYNSDLFRQETITSVRDALSRIIQLVTQDASRPLEQILSEAGEIQRSAKEDFFAGEF